MLCLVVLNCILVGCPWLITTKETIQPIQPSWLLCFFCDDGTCRKTLNLGLPRTNPASSSNGRLQNSPYFCVFKYAWAVKQKVWNEAENRERDWGETLKIRTVGFFSLASHALRACEARALRARKSLTPRFTDFFTDFEKKTDCFAVYSNGDYTRGLQITISALCSTMLLCWIKTRLRL